MPTRAPLIEIMNGHWTVAYPGVPASASVLAFVTTLHCAVMMLLKHRLRQKGVGGLIVLPSIFFVVSPWLLSTPLWLATIFATHIAWLLVCDKLLSPVPKLDRKAAAPRSTSPKLKQAAAPVRKPAASQGFMPLPVYAVFSETPEIRTFRFERPQGFTFKPGQFVMVRVEIDGKPAVRCYSISSSPSAAGYLEISVRKQGQVSGMLHATIRPGTLIHVRGPGGTFVYPEGTRPMVLLAAGIGITPLLSMLRHAVDSEPSRPVTLLFSAKTEEHLPFLDELRLLARRHPQLRLAIALSRGSERQEFFSGRIDRSLIEAAVDHVRESVYLLCGPSPMIEEMTRVLESVGVPPTQVHYEKFEAAVAGASVAAASPVARPSLVGGGVGETPSCLRLTMKRSGRSIEVTDGQTILDAAESVGEELPSMCRAGVCGTCQVRLVEGEVDGEFDVIDEAERAQGAILACVARPLTDCVIDA